MAISSSAHLQYPVKRTAYSFDGHGNFVSKDWDLQDLPLQNSEGFSWYHVELPRSVTRLATAARYLIDIVCPPLKLQDILALVSNGPFCGHVDRALIFRVNSAGPTTSKYTHKLAVRATENSVISVSLGPIPRLGFSKSLTRSLLAEVPVVEPNMDPHDLEVIPAASEKLPRQGVVIQEQMLDFLLTMNHSESADSRVPTCISNLIVHVIDKHVDQLQDVVTKLEMNVDEVELELDSGGYVWKQKMLEDRIFPKMRLDLQRLLQVIAHGEQVFPRLNEKCVGRTWLITEDLLTVEILIRRLQKLKENLGFLANRITALQAGLDSWQSERINHKLYYLSFLSIIFLPLSIVTAAFGMNVGGIPWTEQKNTSSPNGFRNVLFLCAVILLLLLVCFWTGPLYKSLKKQQLKQSVRQKWLSTKKSLKWRGNRQNGLSKAGYFRL